MSNLRALYTLLEFYWCTSISVVFTLYCILLRICLLYLYSLELYVKASFLNLNSSDGGAHWLHEYEWTVRVRRRCRLMSKLLWLLGLCCVYCLHKPQYLQYTALRLYYSSFYLFTKSLPDVLFVNAAAHFHITDKLSAESTWCTCVHAQQGCLVVHRWSTLFSVNYRPSGRSRRSIVNVHKSDRGRSAL